MSSDEFDNLPDDFADLQDVDWVQILAAPSHTASMQLVQAGPTYRTESPATVPESNTTTTSSSSYLSDDDDMNSSFLAELDRVEQQVVQGTRQPGGGPHVGVNPRTAVRTAREGYGVGTSFSKGNVEEISNVPSNVPSKRPRPNEPTDPVSPKRKGKMKASDDVQGMLSAYEDDLTCPICCDIFVFAHVGNPCGHTICGECGWLWHVENKNKGCPYCRRQLEANHPMIPNIAMDNVVDKHVQALAASGAQEWEPGGRKYKEWAERKQAWKDSAAKRERHRAARVAQKKPRSYAIQVLNPFGPPIEWVDNVEEDPTYEQDSDVELIPRPMRRALRRRSRNPGGSIETEDACSSGLIFHTKIERMGVWGEFEFDQNGREDAPESASSAYWVSLGSSLPSYDTQEKTLYLPVLLPADECWARRILFTYRVVYPSGETIWLGAFGQNGTLFLDPVEANILHGLSLQTGWEVDEAKGGRVFAVQGAVDSLPVAKIPRMTDFRIWALGKDSFLPRLRDTSLVFLVPRPQLRSVVLYPTYILAASPGLTVTVSTDGLVAISGTGNVILRTHDIVEEDLEQFLRQTISHTILDDWWMLTVDSNSKAAILASNARRYPINAAVIPFWPSEHLRCPLRLELKRLQAAFDEPSRNKDFALYSPYNLQIHAFGTENQGGVSEDVVLEYDDLNGDFTLCPIYRLQTPGNDQTSRKSWAAIILNPHTVIPPFPSEDVLPTPPPSPHLKPIAHLLHVTTESRMSSVPSLPSDTGLSIRHSASVEAQSSRASSVSPDDEDNPRLTITRPPRPPSPTTSTTLSLFRTIFASVTVFLRLFCRFFSPRAFFGFGQLPGNGHSVPPRSDEDTMAHRLIGPSEPSAEVTEETNPEVLPIAVEKTTDTIAAESDPHPDADVTLLSKHQEQLYTMGPESSTTGLGPVRTTDRPIVGEGPFYAELHFSVEDLFSKQSTVAVALFLFPNISTPENAALDDGHSANATSVPNLNGLETAVRFLDGPHSGCTVSKCVAFAHGTVSASNQDPTRGQLETQDRNCCYLLEYELDREGVQKNSTVISISSSAIANHRA
ncbi:hypothetical protein NLJ89_g2782 [Agrocybe chaxingu]|uniref:RING-type domain-containing protein n=1 Tax=Agrocybe chaxingu TaxID=84603 RepID=A0A9W8MXV1_9AGAR|nr:hypothetical protein NLJ89_g2782 [Agrocybe chaxingu]